MGLELLHEQIAPITGAALYDIANDKNIVDRQPEKESKIFSDSRYKKEKFSYDFGGEKVTFGKMGTNNRFEDALQGPTWTARTAYVTTTATITKAGDITFNYSFKDKLDLSPDRGSTVNGDNVATFILGGVGHGLLGASKMETHASWKSEVKAVKGE
jgi:hypothetical protein